jgi:hypothetical protein
VASARIADRGQEEIVEQPSEALPEVPVAPAQEFATPTMGATFMDDDPTPNGPPVPAIGIAGAALGGGALLLLVRRRARRRREQATGRKQVEAATATAAGRAKGAAIKAKDAAVKAKDVAAGVGSAATTVGSKVRTGVDRMADDRRLQVYAITGAAAAWLYLKLAEVRQLRRISRTVAVAR